MLTHRLHGKEPYRIVLVEGGPGARGSLQYVATQLAKGQGVVEYLQVSTSINGQVTNLSNLIKEHVEGKAIVIGHSWGGMLATRFSLMHPDQVAKLVLVGCGSFVEPQGDMISKTRLSRMSYEVRIQYTNLLTSLEIGDNQDQDMKKVGELIAAVDTFSQLNPNPEERFDQDVEVNFEIHSSIWSEAEGLRRNSHFLPVLQNPLLIPVWVIHGDYDPHPLANVTEPLSALFSNLTTVVLSKCGHYPWREQYAAQLFFDRLHDIIVDNSD